jgi:hypothetical protein
VTWTGTGNASTGTAADGIGDGSAAEHPGDTDSVMELTESDDE